MQSPPQVYARSQVVVHWLTLLLMLVNFVSHDAMEAAWRLVRRGHDAAFTPDLGVRVHVIAGIAVLVLTLVRIGLRLRLGAPTPPEGQHPLITVAAAIVHGLLYLMLLALPLAGMAAWFGGVVIMGDVHGILFGITLGLVAAHVLAAIYHHFVLRDSLLSRMAWRR